MRLFDLFWRGGPLMWPILVCSVTAVTLAAERWWTLRRHRLDTTALLADLSRAAGPAARQLLCEQAGPLYAALAAAVEASAGQPLERRLAQVDSLGHELLARLEAPLSALRAVSEIAPLLGFLGTVVGLIQAFEAIVAQGATTPPVIAAGVATALITTAGGLLAGLPALCAYHALVLRLERLAAAGQRVTQHLLDLTADVPC
ncbi:MAG: MotA/TolQ/ExbB proton channel family protein [Fimbriimonadaceae bacterium]|nr:MotA/TolQ/ExbB proton channel family protein [Fimbriimonadaceae bacterium]